MSLRAFILLWLFFSFYASVHASQVDKEKIVELKKKTEKFLDQVESSSSKVWGWTKKHRQVVKGVSGALILFYGSKFGYGVHVLSYFSHCD
jgi:hypothetical protein